jgi:hypothetical protein
MRTHTNQYHQIPVGQNSGILMTSLDKPASTYWRSELADLALISLSHTPINETPSTAEYCGARLLSCDYYSDGGMPAWYQHQPTYRHNSPGSKLLCADQQQRRLSLWKFKSRKSAPQVRAEKYTVRQLSASLNRRSRGRDSFTCWKCW